MTPIDSDLPERVLERFGAAPLSTDVTLLEDEIIQLQELIEDLDAYIFLEDESTKLHRKLRMLTRNAPDLATARNHVLAGLSIIDRGLQDMLDAAKAIEDAIVARQQRIDELTG